MIRQNEEIIRYDEELKGKGIKTYDALHISCAVNADCEYFITTDRKLLNYEVDGIRILDPVAFISEQEDETND